MKLSQTREVIRNNLIMSLSLIDDSPDDVVLEIDNALNDYTQIIIEMVEEQVKEVEKKQKTMLENDERDRNTYQRTGLKTDYDKVVLNEGTTAHLNAGRLMGKIEALNDIKEELGK